MGLCCWVKCQSCCKAVLIVQLRAHQSSPGRCIVTVWVLTCFINQSYWIASCYFYSQWHDLPARGLTSWCACIDLMLWAREQSGEPSIISPTHNTQKLIWQYIMHTRTFQCSGIVYSIPSIFFEGWYQTVAHRSLLPPQPLSVNKLCLRCWAREYRLKRDVFHLSTAIILPIRQDIFISMGRRVRLHWAESCALMGRDNRLSGVRYHPSYPAIHFH